MSERSRVQPHTVGGMDGIHGDGFVRAGDIGLDGDGSGGADHGDLLFCSAGWIFSSPSRLMTGFTAQVTALYSKKARCRHPSLQRMQGRMSLGRPSIAFLGHSGSAYRGGPALQSRPCRFG